MMIERDFVIVGAGPAGMAAAAQAASHGAQVTLVDENHRLGGKVLQGGGLRGPHRYSNPRERQTARGLFRAFEREGRKIELYLGTAVWGITAEKIVALQQPAAASGRPGRLKARKVLICPGALERVVPFPNWTLPGVFTIGGLNSLVKNGVLPGKTFLLAGSGPLLLVLAANLIRAGGQVAAVVYAGSLKQAAVRAMAFVSAPGLRKLMEGLGYLRSVYTQRVPVYGRHIITRALGETQVRGAVFTAVDAQWRPVRGTEQGIEADAIACSYGLTPSNELLRQCGCRQLYDWHCGYWSTRRNQCMETSVPGVFVAGDGGYVRGYEAAIAEGRLAAVEACAQLGLVEPIRARQLKTALERMLLPHERIGRALDALSQPGPGIFNALTADTVVCRCEEVTVADIRKAARCGAVDINDLKRRTRCGMGHCQGRFCGRTANELLRRFGINGERILFTPRLPVKPVTFGSLAGS